MSMFSNPIAIDYERINRGRIPKTERNDWIPFQFKKPEPPEFVNVADDELLLGYEPYDDEFESKVVWPYPRNRRMTIVIVGGQGSGKTILMKALAYDQLHYRFDHPLFVIDPKLDSHSAMKPNYNLHFREILKKYNIAPKGYKIKHVVPKFMDLYGSIGKASGNEIYITFKDFQPMDRDTRVATMCQILDVKTDEPAYAVISQIMMDDPLPDTPEAFLRKMSSIMSEQKIKTERLKWKFEGLMKTQKFGTQHFDFYNEMKQHGIVALEGTIGDEKTVETMTQGVFVNLAIYNVVNARIWEIRSGKRGKTPYVVMDESSNFAGRDGLSAGIMTALSTKYRAINDMAGIGSVVVSQFLWELAPKIVSEAELVICPRLTDQRDIQILKDRNCDTYLFDDMHFDPNNRPNDWIAFGRNGLSDYKIFKPLPTASWMGSA